MPFRFSQSIRFELARDPQLPLCLTRRESGQCESLYRPRRRQLVECRLEVNLKRKVVDHGIIRNHETSS